MKGRCVRYRCTGALTNKMELLRDELLGHRRLTYANNNKIVTVTIMKESYLPDKWEVFHHSHPFGSCWRCHIATSHTLEECIVRRKNIAETKKTDHASRAKLDKLPHLAEFMTAAFYEDGTPRQAPTLSIWCQGNEWKANIRDRAEALCMWLSADTFDELLKLVNEFCLADNGPWRVDDRDNPRDGKRLPKRS